MKNYDFFFKVLFGYLLALEEIIFYFKNIFVKKKKDNYAILKHFN